MFESLQVTVETVITITMNEEDEALFIEQAGHAGYARHELDRYVQHIIREAVRHEQG